VGGGYDGTESEQVFGHHMATRCPRPSVIEEDLDSSDCFFVCF